MDASDYSSDTGGESQATQLLQQILDTGANSSCESKDVRRPTNGDNSNVSKDASTDTLPRNSAFPHYSFHGLADTQTDTQPCGQQYNVNAGLRKENFNNHVHNGEPRRTIPFSNTRQHSPQSTSSKNASTRERHVEKPSRSSSRVKMPISIIANSASVRSRPVATTEPDSTVPLNPTIPPPTHFDTDTTPQSQDSFAGAISQDPAQQYQADSKRFNMPLSELGRDLSTDGPSGSEAELYANSSMFARRISPNFQGNILVASTPSNTDSSQSQSQSQSQEQPTQPFSQEDSQDAGMFGQAQPLYTDVMAVDEEADAGSQQSTQGYESSAPSSSYGRYLNGERDPSPVLDATQPSTQREDVDMAGASDINAATTATWETDSTGDINTNQTSNALAASSATTTTRTSAPRGLMSLINPAHKHRYAKYQNPATSRGAPFTHQSLYTVAPPQNDKTQKNLLQETQPSDVADESTMPSKRQWPSTRTATSSTERNPSRNPRNDPSPTPGQDQMDVVPDSEPLRDESPSRGESRTTPEIPSKKGRHLDSDPNLGSRINKSPLMVVNEDEGTEPEDHDGDVKMNAKAELSYGDLDDDEEDIPLAAMTLNRGNGKVADRKGKGSTTVTNPEAGQLPYRVKQPSRGTKSKGSAPLIAHIPGPVIAPNSKETRTTRAAAAAQSGKSSGPGPSWETGEVPSSVPDQDIVAKPSSGRKAKTTKATRGGKAAGSARPTTRAGLKARQRKVDDEDGEEEGRLSTEASTDEERTELADEDYMEAGLEVSGPASRKRKRGAKVSKAPTRATSKASTKASKPSIVSSSTRQAKRLRSVSTNDGVVRESTRVFAMWKQDGHYYPGVTHAHQGGGQYLIKFDDKTEGTVSINHMRLCELHVGDDVLVPQYTRSSKVVDVSKLESDNIVSISLHNEIEERGMADIRIASRTIAHAWKDRILDPEHIITTIKPVKLKPSPSPSKLSMLSAPSTRGSRRNIFANTGLVVTLSVGNENWERDKEKVMSAIKNNGGTVIDDWASVIRMNGKHTHTNNRWVVQKEDVQWNGSDDIERVFLLADDSNQKPKFLIALALGIPCLSMTWLHESVEAGKEQDWLGYMLPQGYSEALIARPSQQVDVDWGNSIHQVKDIMSNLVASKLFSNLSILCVGPEMVPQPKGKKLAGTDEKAQEANNAVVRIILSMGAKRVEAVSELKYASESISEFDYVVIKETYQYIPALAEGNTVHWAWVKECLIASRLLPVPEWPQSESDSQPI